MDLSYQQVRQQTFPRKGKTKILSLLSDYESHLVDAN